MYRAICKLINKLSISLMIILGIDTSNALLEEMRAEKAREKENQSFLLQPLLALTLAQPGAVFDIPTHLLRLRSFDFQRLSYE